MRLKAGIIIESTEALDDTYFESATIIISEYNNNGAVGFVINKPSHRKLNDLEEFKHVWDFPLYEGGPVDPGHLFFIHARPDLIEGGTYIGKSIYFGGDFKQAISCIRNNLVTTGDIKIFIGYCGWNIAELEAEVMEGSWILSADDAKVVTFKYLNQK